MKKLLLTGLAVLLTTIGVNSVLANEYSTKEDEPAMVYEKIDSGFIVYDNVNKIIYKDDSFKNSIDVYFYYSDIDDYLYFSDYNRDGSIDVLVNDYIYTPDMRGTENMFAFADSLLATEQDWISRAFKTYLDR